MVLKWCKRLLNKASIASMKDILTLLTQKYWKPQKILSRLLFYLSSKPIKNFIEIGHVILEKTDAKPKLHTTRYSYYYIKRNHYFSYAGVVCVNIISYLCKYIIIKIDFMCSFWFCKYTDFCIFINLSHLRKRSSIGRAVTLSFMLWQQKRFSFNHNFPKIITVW